MLVPLILIEELRLVWMFVRGTFRLSAFLVSLEFKPDGCRLALYGCPMYDVIDVTVVN